VPSKIAENLGAFAETGRIAASGQVKNLARRGRQLFEKASQNTTEMPAHLHAK